jgi:hypothetical protein
MILISLDIFVVCNVRHLHMCMLFIYLHMILFLFKNN